MSLRGLENRLQLLDSLDSSNKKPRHTLYAQTKRRLFIDSSLTPMTLNWYTKAQTFVLKVPHSPKNSYRLACAFLAKRPLWTVSILKLNEILTLGATLLGPGEWVALLLCAVAIHAHVGWSCCGRHLLWVLLVCGLGHTGKLLAQERIVASGFSTERVQS